MKPSPSATLSSSPVTLMKFNNAAEIPKIHEEMNEQIEKANKFADKEYKKERFDEAGKKQKTIKFLRSINERLGIKQEETTKI